MKGRSLRDDVLKDIATIPGLSVESITDPDSLYEEIKSLRQKLTSRDAEIERLKTVPMRYRRMAFNAQLQDENAQLSQQLADSQKQVTLLREAMQGAWKDGYCFVGPEGQTDEQKAFEQALTTTEPKP